MTELLKLREVADELGISEPTARRYVKSGLLPSVYIGGRYQVRRADVARFLRDAEVHPSDTRPKGGAPSSNLEEAREHAAFVIVGRVVETDEGQTYRMVVRWNVPEEERGAYRPKVEAMLGGDYIEEDLSPEAEALLAAGV